MDNKGFSLVEVIVSSIIIGLLLISLVTAFAAVRKVNTASSKQDAAISLSSALFEELRNIRYDTIDSADAFKKNIFLADFGVGDVEYNGDENSKTVVLHNVTKDLGTFEVTVDMKPSDKAGVNDFQYPNIVDVASEDAVIIDIKTMTAMYSKDEVEKYVKNEDGSYEADYSNSYDDLVINDLVDKNKIYIQKLYDERCKEIDKLNEEYGFEVSTEESTEESTEDGTEKPKGEGLKIPYPTPLDEAVYGVDEFAFIPEDEIKKIVSRKMEIYTGKHNNYRQLDCTLKYEVTTSDCLDIFGEEDVKFEFEIYASKYLDDLADLYLVYDGTDFDKDEITLVNGRDVVEDSLEYNLYFIVGNLFNDAYKNGGSIDIANKIQDFEFKFNQISPSPLVTLFTNYEWLESANYKERNNSCVFDSADEYTRLYDVSIVVEDKNGVDLYSETKSSVLK